MVQLVADNAVQHVVVDPSGAWLSPAAAASYQSMLAAGMPAGGISSAGRSNAEQVKLYAEKPDLAAKPGTSPHEAGIALDMNQASAAHKWLLEHGASYGWKRPMSYEPWHWQLGSTAAAKSSIPVVGDVVDAARNLAGDAGGAVANFLGIGNVANDVRKVALQLVFVVGGIGLVWLGLARTVQPAVSRAIGEVL